MMPVFHYQIAGAYTAQLSGTIIGSKLNTLRLRGSTDIFTQ